MEFVGLKNQVVAFGKKMQSVRADHEKKVVEIRKTYVNAKIPQFIRDENECYEKAVQSERLAAINTLNDSVKKLEASQNGGITDKIDTVMLTELNAISQSNMGLTAAELKAVGQRVLASGSAICCRKLTDIAYQSGYQLHLPDPAEAKKVLYEASEQILNFFKFYDGSNPYSYIIIQFYKNIDIQRRITYNFRKRRGNGYGKSDYNYLPERRCGKDYNSSCACVWPLFQGQEDFADRHRSAV